MTYLELCNAVLIRLREDTITVNSGAPPEDFLVNPFYKTIGAHVNDAKDRVEDTWKWSGLRASDTVSLASGASGNLGSTFDLPDSADNHYDIQNVFWGNADDTTHKYAYVREASYGYVRAVYSAGTNVRAGVPQQWSIASRNDSTGNLQITLVPPPDTPNTYELYVDRVKHQPALVLPTDRLKVPSLPVYTLATALASRERGEVGGTPSSELFALADRHLSDAIAQDTALFPVEMDWTAGQIDSRTNVRFA